MFAPKNAREGLALMDIIPSKPRNRDLAGQSHLTSASSIMLAILFGLAAGYLDLILIVFKKHYWNGLRNYANASDFPWSVPVGHVLLLLIPGVLLAVVNWFRPKPMSLRAACGCSRRSVSGPPCCGCPCTASPACYWLPDWAG